MHVPDSALSPATSAIFGAAMVPVWYAAGRRLRETLATRRVPQSVRTTISCWPFGPRRRPQSGQCSGATTAAAA